MNKLRVISTTLIVIAILNTGCVQEKTSKIEPSLAKRVNHISSSTNEINQTSKTENNITVLNLEYQDDNQLEELTLLTNDTQEIGIDVGEEKSEELISEAMPIENNWVEISKEEEIVLTAQEFMGTKYVWAANGPDCFDCSGFTRYVYKEHGMTLPRYSGNQAKVGMTVNYNELQIGDLVFFDTEKKYRGKVNHVGIYIGNNKFIHASSAKKQVVITSFKDKKFYKNRFLWGQRIINSDTAYASL